MSAQADDRTRNERRSRPLARSSYRTPLWHRLAESLIKIIALSAIAAVVLIFAFIAQEAMPLILDPGGNEGLNLADLIIPRKWPGYSEAVYVWQPVGMIPKFNLAPLFVGTLKVTLLTMGLSIPVAIGAAVYVSQYASRRTREILKPAIEFLAGVPSVVLGFFALMLLASWMQNTFGFLYRLNGMVASVGLSLAVIPLIFTVSEDALQAVPKSYSDASSALGARRWQTTIYVVLPAALPGIAAAVILGFGRAIGETMIVLMASGNAAVMDLLDAGASVRTLTATIAAELGEVARGGLHWRILFFLGTLLFITTFLLNWLGTLAVGRLYRKLTAAGRG